ncbi:MAG TPA: DUF2695 domain-containing protein [Armatimonadota bacterium]|nr:DUF2695 domain-containing protein [Armatimonadota bacterium]
MQCVEAREPTASPGEPPIPYPDLRDLFVLLDRPNPRPCSHTHRETVRFLQERQLLVEPTLDWLRANGGHCDCEIIYNVSEEWGGKVGWEPR